MKLKYAFLLISISLIICGQNYLVGQEQQTFQHAISAEELNLSQHTLLMLEKQYTSEEIQLMTELAPEKLRFLNYYYSSSFQIKEGQNYSTDQILLIDVIVYQDLRKPSETVEVFDEVSSLILILDPIETIGHQVGAPDFFKTPNQTGKIAND